MPSVNPNLYKMDSSSTPTGTSDYPQFTITLDAKPNQDLLIDLDRVIKEQEKMTTGNVPPSSDGTTLKPVPYFVTFTLYFVSMLMFVW